MRTVLGLLIVAACLLTAAVVSGCGASDSVDPTAVAAAAGATARAGGAEMTSTGTLRIDGLSRPIRFTAAGQTDSTGRKARMLMNMSDFAQVAPQAGKPSDWKLGMVVDFPTIYMRFPVLAKQVGKPWVKWDIEKVANGLGINAPGLLQGNDNPRQYVDYLRSVNADVKRVGTETVRGVKTTHYKATVDLRRYPDKLPPSQRAQARAATERLIKLTGTSTYPVEVWLDSKRLVRRFEMAYSMKVPNTTQRMKLEQTTELYGFGLKPKIEPPPADQVKDITDLAAKQAQQSGLGK